MLVEISEAIRLLPTFFFIKICKNFPNTIDKHYLTAAAAAAAAFTKARILYHHLKTLIITVI